MAKQVTFSIEALQKLVEEGIKQALEARKGQAISSAKAAKSERSIKNEIACVRAFKKAGFGNVKPHVDVKTFNRWMVDGFRPTEGSKAVKVKNLRLFHRTQVRQLTIEEKQALNEQNAEAVAKYDAEHGPQLVQ